MDNKLIYEATKAAEVVRPILSRSQFDCMAELSRGEEGEFFLQSFVDLAKQLKEMPELYEQDGKGDQAVAHLHFFLGDSHWYITEIEVGRSVLKAFGYTILNGDDQCAELGYISIEELTEFGAEIDLHYTPRTLGEIKASRKPEEDHGTFVVDIPEHGALMQKQLRQRIAMSAIPESYLNIINPIIDAARNFLEQGEDLRPRVFFGCFDSGMIVPIPINLSSEKSKDASAEIMRLAALQIEADFVLVIMEAWTMKASSKEEVDAVIDKYGSIGESPFAIEVVSFSLETAYGMWMAKEKIEAKGEARTIGIPDFQHFDGVSGRFAHLLPPKTSDDQYLTLH